MTTPNKDVNNEKELRPCPICAFEGPIESPAGYIGCGNQSCSAGSSFIKKEEWQSAYCWKLLDKKDEALRIAVVALEKITGTLPGEVNNWKRFHRISEEALAKLEEVLGE